jgi:D-amino-acid dehydrogenase
MRIAVLGSGVIGVTSAYYLAGAGHEVDVIDRQPAPGMETSFANAGEISPGYASPWAAPGIPLKALKWLFMRHSPLIVNPRLDPHMIRWMLSMLRQCTHSRYALNKERMMRLAEFSRDRLIDLRAATGIQYSQRTLGTLEVFRSQKEFDAVAKDVEVLKANAVPFEILDRTGCVSVEPGLASGASRIVGGLRLPNDETGDCFEFTTALATLAAAKGVTFRHGELVKALHVTGDKVESVSTDRGTVTADAYVMALGSYTPAVLRPLSIALPVYPVKGYSLTAPLRDESHAPQSTVMDERFKVAITRLGNRIRVGGMAELAGFSRRLPGRRRETLEHSLESLFPGGGDLPTASFWCGLRPMTPDGTPVIGPTKIRNVFLNTGHGTLGWTMACGSAHILTDMIGGTRPAIETADLSIERYGRHGWGHPESAPVGLEYK